VPTVAHYLLVDPERSEIVWHRRAADGAVQPPAVVRERSLSLDPPGIEVAVADIFPTG